MICLLLCSWAFLSNLGKLLNCPFFMSDYSALLISSASPSACASVDKYASLLFRMKSRVRSIEFQSSVFHRSKCPGFYVTQDLAILRGLISRLVYNPLITPTFNYDDISRRFRCFGSVSEHFDRLFGEGNWLPRCSSGTQDDPVLSVMLASLRDSTRRSRAMTWLERCRYEVSERLAANWCAVFGTLTVNDHSYDEVFGDGANAWQKYRQSCQKMAARACYGSFRAAADVDIADYFSCIAVLEYGSKSGRAHIHYLMFFRKLDISDPNSGRYIADLREITEHKAFWRRYGFSTPIMFRYSFLDGFGRMGFRMPVAVNSKGVAKLPVNRSSDFLTNYVCKYIFKAYENYVRDIPWRVKATRSFGCRKLDTVLARMSVKHLYALYLSPTLFSEPLTPPFPHPLGLNPEWYRVNGRPLSLRLLRSRILKLIFSRLRRTESGRLKILKSLKLCVPRPSLVELLTFLIHRRHAPSFVSIGPLPTPKLTRTAIFSFWYEYEFEALSTS